MSQEKISSREWRERDRKALWHPFTQHTLWENEDFPVIVSGEGVYLYDADGKKYLDGVSSLWVNAHGHRRPEIDEAVRAQLGRMAHSTFLGLSHPPGIELAEKLISIAPPGLTRVFFSDNGSTAMEVALKMAFQYWRQGEEAAPECRQFVRFDNAYHGDTVGAVSVGGIEMFHETYRPLLFPTIPVHSPYCYRCHLPLSRTGFLHGYYHDERTPLTAEGRPEIITKEDCLKNDLSGCLLELEAVLSEHRYGIAGVVIEPLVQAAAGMIIQPKGFIKGVRELCDKYGALMIADEVAVGFGRTGKMFACEWEGVKPDIMAVGKGLTGGYLPLAATLTTEEVFEKFLGPNHYINTLFHGHTYTANPLACAAALASLDLFEKDQTIRNVHERALQAVKELERLWKLDHVGDIRHCGLMFGIELEKDPHDRIPYDQSLMMGRQVALAAREKGLIIRPLGDVVVLMPPLCIQAPELDKMMEITWEAIKEVTK